MSTNKPAPVELDDLLAAEFDYIAQTASQAHEDRARVSSFYLIAVGSLIATLFSAQFFELQFFTQMVKIIFGGLFVMLTLLGTSTIAQLAILRSAWYESMMAMNQIKDFAMDQNPELVKAFRWKTSTLPSKYKTGSIAYFQTLEVALISGLMFGVAAFFLQQAFFSVNIWNWIVSAALGGLTVYIQLVVYKRALK